MSIMQVLVLLRNLVLLRSQCCVHVIFSVPRTCARGRLSIAFVKIPEVILPSGVINALIKQGPVHSGFSVGNRPSAT